MENSRGVGVQLVMSCECEMIILLGCVGWSIWKDECAFARTRTVSRHSRFWKQDDVHDSRH